MIEKYSLHEISEIERLRNSRNGNPTFLLTFAGGAGGTMARTASDAAFAYEIGNPGMRIGSKVEVQLSKTGRVLSMRPAET